MAKVALDDYLASGGTVPDLKSAAIPLDDVHPEWFDPIPLAHAHELPRAPLHALSPWLTDHASQLSEETQTQPDLSLIMALGALSTAVQRKFEVTVRDGWTEPLNTFGLAVQESGTRKTAVVTKYTEPIRDAEAELIAAAKDQIAKECSRKRILEKQLQAAESDAAKDGGEVKKLAAEAVAMELAKLTIPPEPKLLVDDITPEKTNSVLADLGAASFISDEGGAFNEFSGSYSQNGSANFDVLLKGHAGSDIRVDRVSRPSEIVRRPAVTMALVVQPSVLEGLAATPSFRGKGLLARFAYVVPRSLVGNRNARATAMAPEVSEVYAANITALLRFVPKQDVNTNGAQGPVMLTMSDEARELLITFLEELEPHLGPTGSLGHIADWGGKLAGLCARYVGLLHLADQAPDLIAGKSIETTIPSPVVKRALEIGRYLIPHALTAFSIMGGDPAMNDARYVLTVIQSRGRDSFTLRDLFEATKGTLKKMDRLRSALDVLEDHQFVRTLHLDDKAGAGRKKSPIVTVNPAVFTQSANSANSANGHKDAPENLLSLIRFPVDPQPDEPASAVVTPFAEFAHSHNGSAAVDRAVF